MTKAKLMISAIGLIAVLSPILAFKTQKISHHYLWTGTLGSGVCTSLVYGRAFSNGIKAVAASTGLNMIDCPDVYTIAISDN